MAITNKNFSHIPTTGFGEKSNDSSGRFLRKDGQPNVRTRGLPFFDRFSWYHSLISMPLPKFFLVLFGVYMSVNLLFAAIYYLVGIEHLTGIDKAPTRMVQFVEALFFSAQTLTTVGYGRIAPSGFLTSFVASAEAFIGVLSFALASGLFYGRFARPRSFLKFSEHAVIAPYKGGMALMFRTAPFKNNHLIDAEVKLTLAQKVVTDDGLKNQFFDLKPEFEKINSLSLNWTVVHAINEDSPLFGQSESDLLNQQAEVLVFIKAFDELFSSTVVARTSYTAAEMKWGARFAPMYFAHPDGGSTTLDLGRLNWTEPAPLPLSLPDKSE